MCGRHTAIGSKPPPTLEFRASGKHDLPADARGLDGVRVVHDHAQNVGGGLLPMRVGQSMHVWPTYRHREQAPAHIGVSCIRKARSTRRRPGLDGVRGVHDHAQNVGGGLLPMRVCQSMHVWPTYRQREQTPSHTGVSCIRKARSTRRRPGLDWGSGRARSRSKCGRGLAPDEGGSVNACVADIPPSGASPLPHFLSHCTKAIVGSVESTAPAHPPTWQWPPTERRVRPSPARWRE